MIKIFYNPCRHIDAVICHETAGVVACQCFDAERRSEQEEKNEQHPCGVDLAAMAMSGQGALPAHFAGDAVVHIAQLLWHLCPALLPDLTLYYSVYLFLVHCMMVFVMN